MHNLDNFHAECSGQSIGHANSGRQWYVQSAIGSLEWYWDLPFSGLDRSHSRHSIGGSRLHAAVHGNGTYSDGTTQNLTSTVTWTSSKTTVATVNSGGMAASVAQGTASIKATSGTDQRLGDVDGHSRRTDFDCSHSRHSIGISRSHAAVHGNGNLQQRHNSEPDQHCHLDFLKDHRSNCDRRFSYQRGPGQRNHHSQIRNDQRVGNLYRYGCGSNLDCSHSRHSISGSWLHTAVHGYRNLQQRYNQNLTSTATWTSSKTTVATVTGGLATSVAPGSGTITAKSGTISGSATFTVTAAVLTSIAVTPATATVAAGSAQQFTATGTYSNGTTHNLTPATWTSSATSIATISGGGLATSVAQGSATITAKSGTISGSATLTVLAPVLTSLSVTPGSASVPAGGDTAVYGDGDLQRRQHAEPDRRGELEFDSARRGHDRKRWFSHRKWHRQRHHHRHFRLDHGFRNTQRGTAGVAVDGGHARQSVLCAGHHATVRSDGNRQRRQYSEPDQLGRLEHRRPNHRHGERARAGR